MPVNFDNNVSVENGDELVEVDVTSEYDEGHFLSLAAIIGERYVVDAVLTDKDEVRNFRDMVVFACNDFLERLGETP